MCNADKCSQAVKVQLEKESSACLHVYHTLGTNDHVTASLKLAVLSIILLTNVRIYYSVLSHQPINSIRLLMPAEMH